jgi:hypothetical protein
MTPKEFLKATPEEKRTAEFDQRIYRALVEFEELKEVIKKALQSFPVLFDVVK